MAMVGPMEHQPTSTVKHGESRRPRLVAFRRIKTTRAFEEIAEQIRNELSTRRLRAGDRLPPERALAAKFGVSRNTLSEPLRSL
jgi:GntR family transcriptional regulator, transcriptional repressor for pyruvate dehydrogenase complex